MPDKPETGNQKPRKPMSFTVTPQPEEVSGTEKQQTIRKPVAIRDLSMVTTEAVDVFEQEAIDAGAELNPPPASLIKRRFTLRSVFFSAMGLLISFAIGIWTEDLIRALFNRADWLGWLALGVAIIALGSLIALVVREALALRRLSAVQELRFAAAEATERNDVHRTEFFLDQLRQFLSDVCSY